MCLVNESDESEDGYDGPTYDKKLRHQCRCQYSSNNMNYCSGWVCEIEVIQDQCISGNHQVRLSD